MVTDKRSSTSSSLPEWWDDFLDALVVSGNNREYAHWRTKTAPADLDRAIRTHPHLKQRLQEVPSIIAGKLVSAAFERAIEGWEEPVYYQGDEVGSKRKYSDTNLGRLLRAYVAAFDPKANDDGGMTPEQIRAVADEIIARMSNGKPQS